MCVEQIVLQRRDAIQADYERTMDELTKRRDEREQVVNVSISNLHTAQQGRMSSLTSLFVHYLTLYGSSSYILLVKLEIV